MGAARLKSAARIHGVSSGDTDHHLWLSGALPEFWAATQALALRAALGHGALVFIAGDAIRWCARDAFSSASGDEARELALWKSRQVDPEALLNRARALAPIHLTACSLSLELNELTRPQLAPWIDDLAGAASFWHHIPEGRTPWVF